MSFTLNECLSNIALWFWNLQEGPPYWWENIVYEAMDVHSTCMDDFDLLVGWESSRWALWVHFWQWVKFWNLQEGPSYLWENTVYEAMDVHSSCMGDFNLVVGWESQDGLFGSTFGSFNLTYTSICEKGQSQHLGIGSRVPTIMITMSVESDLEDINHVTLFFWKMLCWKFCGLVWKWLQMAAMLLSPTHCFLIANRITSLGPHCLFPSNGKTLCGRFSWTSMKMGTLSF